MKSEALLFGLTTALLTLTAPAAPPAMGPPDSAALGGAMRHLFRSTAAFSAQGQIVITEGQRQTTMPMEVAFRDGKFRTEMDLTKMTGGNLPAEALPQMKAMGMDKMVIISRPDRKVNFMVYPSLQGYVEMTQRESEAAASSSDCKVDVVDQGKETVNGHSCLKRSVTVTCPGTEPARFIVWNATDLKDFPVKYETTSQRSTVVTQFESVKFQPPPAAQFEPPADAKKYGSMQELMMSSMSRMMQ